MSTTIPGDSFAIIIGAMKCGTTSLYEHLVRHPQICPSSMKEPEFFSRNQGHGLAGGVPYEDLWEFDPVVHRYVLEASTGYTKFPVEQGVPERMRDYGLQPRLLYLVRDPFERIESHYNYMTRSPTWTHDLTDDHLIEVSRYARQLEEYERCFPRKSLLVLDFDELRTDAAATVARALTFLDLPELPQAPEPEVRNPTERLSSAEMSLRAGRAGALFRLLPGPVRRAGRKLLRSVAPPAPKRRLTDDERAIVRDSLAPDMRRLQDEYGVDVTRWGF